MPVSQHMRRGLLAAAILACVIGLGLCAVIAALDAGYFQDALLGYMEKSTGRKITVAGPLHVRLFSLHPSVSAQRVTIGNPPWTTAGVTAKIEALDLVFAVPLWGHRGRIDSLRMQGATLTLNRDAAGHANWQRSDPDKGDGTPLPLIAGLSAVNIRTLLDDQHLHLEFDGILSAQDAVRPGAARALQVRGVGQLNGRAVSVELTGDALPSASYDQPYGFSFTEKSSGSLLSGRGSVPKPFDFNFLDVSFDASGADLHDLYFLTGASLINTGAYRLTGHFSRSANRTQFTDLRLRTGHSDANGTLELVTVSGRSEAHAKLHSQNLRSADFGLRAAGREAAPDTRLVSNAAVNPEALRRGDGTVDFEASRVEVGRQTLQDLAVKLRIQSGVVTAEPLSAGLLGGKLRGRVKFDATEDPPRAEVDLSMVELQLAQWPHHSVDPPVEGAVRARLVVTGRGASAHEVAASAEGMASVALPQGLIRASLAELVGMDLRGIGLILENSKRDTPIRCAKVDFAAHAGVFRVQRLTVDTAPVRIAGDGSIEMGNETLDLTLHGEPKSLRVLRLRAPLRIQGTLAHPSFGIAKGDSKLLLVDPGRAKDVDCAALLR